MESCAANLDEGPGPPEDGRLGRRPSTKGGAREHAALMKVWQPAQPPEERLSLATLGDYLQEETARLPLEKALLLLSAGWRRAEEGGVVPSTWPGIAPLQESARVAALSRLLVAPAEDKVQALSAILESHAPPRFVGELLGSAAEDDAVPPQMLAAVGGPLRGRHLNDLRSHEFSKLMRVLSASKRYIIALVGAPCFEQLWMPPFKPKFVWRNRKREVIGSQRPGMLLQTDSLLGWLLSPTPMDYSLIPPSLMQQTEAGAPEWANVKGLSRHRIEALQGSTRVKVANAQSQAAEFCDLILRAGDEPRLAVLRWLGALVSSAEPRGKQGYVAPEGFNLWPQNGQHVVDILQDEDTPDFERSLGNILLVQTIHARIHGFPTSGVALNAFALVLALVQPIRPGRATSLSAFFALRKDVPELLGASWEAEARFGEREQVEAAGEAAKEDPAFMMTAADKSLFKTQIFWLAAKGVGALLLPVAKEAFHTLEHIVAVFCDKDTATADLAWRELLLAESVLMEPTFQERLGHLVDIIFRFLLHVAAGGAGALPPPTPGPAWHALPSALLQNVLDVCDIYRRQLRGTSAASGIPSGMFANMDPAPVLTCLCIVMASDSHVRDPSLRGRAVKVMHRLCFAFPSWQERLNQPPLVAHFIPCLVGVFIAVEKAILSYYDLAYRYKYELRIPVMDLFELALHHDEHRKVLGEFSRGAGNERFLKLFTQLINDSNSQTEEALRTVKEYHARQASQTPAEPGASGQGLEHDEDVAEDDHSDGGEDVYRRSRMNYKEHAKKYFGLATKTWRQLWLLCKHCAAVAVEGRTILEQLLHSSLDAQLHYLVGPEMKHIKASPQEYEELGFNPKELVRQIVEIYLFLARVSRDEVVRIVAKDERYYSNTTFGKALAFTRKYGLLGASELEEFGCLVQELAERVSQQRAAFDEADIPAEYLCEMMADIMSDPVMFPQSRKIVDRWVAERQVMSTDRDPYANTLVTVEQLVPMPELKEEIHRFAKQHGIALEGGNMFDK